MVNPFRSYMRWLHTQWPAGTVEKLPEVQPDGSTNVPGLYVVGDLTGIPLLKFSSDTGARAVQTIVADPVFQKRDISRGDILDIVIIGAGVSGVSAAAEAKQAGLNIELLEATEPFSTVVNFPRGKPIYTYPTDMAPAGELQFGENTAIKEGLVDELHSFMRKHGVEPRIAGVEKIERKGGVFDLTLRGGEALRAHRVIVGIGRSGNFRKLGIPGEDLDKVYNRLHDPREYKKKHCLIVGGGDSALETAIALARCGAFVTVAYRKPEFSRPKPDNITAIEELAADPFADVSVEEPSSERVNTATGGFMDRFRRPGSIRLMLPAKPVAIRDDEVEIENKDGEIETLPNDVVYTMIGREAPLDFFRRSGVRVRGDRTAWWWASLAGFVLFCFWLYHWKSDKAIPFAGKLPSWLDPDPTVMFAWLSSLNETLAGWLGDPSHLLGTIARSASGPSFYYTLAYSLLVVVFGIRRIRRRKTPYIKVQTLTLMAVQVFPLFILPEMILPWLGANGVFESGTTLGHVADWMFEPYDKLGHARAYWRSYGFILAFPLNVYNIFTPAPLWGWIIVAFLQTGVIIPLLVWKFGKGAYCGWICSCGALAETLGDTHRHKMPHGPFWNRLNMIGQGVLAIATALLALRIVGWLGADWASNLFNIGFKKAPVANYQWFVDLFIAGVVGYGMYFWFSGRVWCRFACPLAALMHIYARFSKFRIIAEKSKCISCNVCTSVCHQGIDVMNFANKGMPMEDPECVRCSACVQSCPTGVLKFGEVNRKTGEVIRVDRLVASPVQMAELTINGARA